MRLVTNYAELEPLLAGKHEVYFTSDVEELLDWHDPNEFGCIIIDIDKTHGVYAPRAIREENSNLPIIGVSAELPHDGDWPAQRASFIEQGGSYLLQVPVNPREMLACIMELGRRFSNTRTLLRLADNRLVINLSHRIAMFDKQHLPFTPKENLLFMELADHVEALRTKENLMSAVYRLEEDEAEIKIIDVFICKIRTKLNRAHPGLGQCIETIWGEGYRLTDIPEGTLCT